MEITEVKIFPVDDPKLRAFASLVFDHCFMVNDIRIVEGRQGLFLSMPNRKRRNGEFKDVAHPLNQETRRWIEERVLADYALQTGGGPARSDAAVRHETAPVVPPVAEPTVAEVQQEHLSDDFWALG